MIVACPIIAALAAGAVSFLLPPIYEAHVSVYVKPAQPIGSTDPAVNGTGLGALIAEAQALKEALHDAYGRSARLVAALKRQRKQSRLMASTLASLRQLQQVGG